MKRHLLYIAIACLSALVSGCEKEQNVVRDFPAISSTTVTAITTAGVTVAATFDEKFINDITDHGVVWGTNPRLSIKDDFQMQGGKPATSSFSFDIASNLAADREYYVRAYVVMKDKVIYGDAIKFTSIGSAGPKIDDLSSKALLPGELLTITGKNFGAAKTTTVSFKGNLYDEYYEVTIDAEVKSFSNTEIVVVFPSGFYDGLRVIIKSEGNPEVRSAKISSIVPDITGITPGSMCDSLVINGTNLKGPWKISSLVVNGSYAPLSSISKNKIVVHSQYRRKQTSIRVEVNTDYRKFLIEKNFEDGSAFAQVTNSAPKFIRPGQTFVLEGNNFPLSCEGLNVQIVEPTYDIDQFLSIADVKDNQVTILSSAQNCRRFKFQLRYYGLIIYTSDYMTTPMSTLVSVTPDNGTLGTEFILHGENIPATFIQAQLKDDKYIFPEVISQTDTEMKGKITYSGLGLVDPFPTATVKMGYEDCGLFQSVPFTLTSPVATITDFNPKTSDGTFSIFITGSNFSIDPELTVKLTDQSGVEYFQFVPDKTDTQLIIFPPTHMPAGTYKLTVTHLGRDYDFADPIILTP